MVIDWKVLRSFMLKVQEVKLTDGRGGLLYHDLLAVYLLISQKKNPVWEASDFDKLHHGPRVWAHVQAVMKMTLEDMPRVASDPATHPVAALFAAHIIESC